MKRCPKLIGKKSKPNTDGQLFFSLITTGGLIDLRPLISARKEVSSMIVYIPFERGESKDYPYIKIFSIKCQIAVHQVKQVKSVFCRRN